MLLGEPLYAFVGVGWRAPYEVALIDVIAETLAHASMGFFRVTSTCDLSGLSFDLDESFETLNDSLGLLNCIIFCIVYCGDEGLLIDLQLSNSRCLPLHHVGHTDREVFSEAVVIGDKVDLFGLIQI
jgi:hypothetical protein